MLQKSQRLNRVEFPGNQENTLVPMRNRFHLSGLFGLLGLLGFLSTPGYSGYQNRRKRYFWLRSASLEDHFAEAQGKIFLAFSLKSAAGGRSSNLYQGNTYP